MKSTLSCLAILLFFLPALGAQTVQPTNSGNTTTALSIAKIEPPNWFVGLPSPVLLLYGEGLAGIQVKTVPPSVKVERVEAGQSGHHAFVWLDTKDAHAGTVTLTVSSPQGSVSVPFELVSRRDAQSGMGGLSVDDAIVRVPLRQFTPAQPQSASSEPANVIRKMTSRLDTFKQAGITTISTSPMSAAGFADAPVTSLDFYGADPRFGTVHDYREFVAAAHARGIKVLLDLQLNHVDPKHPWVSDPPQPNWLHGTPERHETVAVSADIGSITNPHAAAAQRKTLLEGWYGGTFPDLNQQSPRLAQYLIQNVLWWIESTGVDGFRLDEFAFVDRSFWHDFNQQIHKLYPRFETIAEVSTPDPAMASFFVGSVKRFDDIDSGADTALDSPLSSMLQEIVLRHGSAQKVSNALRQDWMYPHPEKLITFFHGDQDFWLSADFPAWQAELAFAALATLRGIPQFNNDDLDTPTNIRKLLAARKDHVALRQGKLYDIAVDDSIYAYARIFLGSSSGFQSIKPENVLVVINASDQPQKRTLKLTDTPLALAQKITDIVPATSARIVNSNIEIELAPASVAIYVVDCGCEL